MNIAALDAFVTKVTLAWLAKEGIWPVSDQRDQDLDSQITAIEARPQQAAVEFAEDPDVTPEQVREMSRRLGAKLDDLRSRQADRLGPTCSAAWIGQTSPISDRRCRSRGGEPSSASPLAPSLSRRPLDPGAASSILSGWMCHRGGHNLKELRQRSRLREDLVHSLCVGDAFGHP